MTQSIEGRTLVCAFILKSLQQIKSWDEIFFFFIYKLRSKNLGIIVKLAVMCEAFKAWVWKHTVYLHVLSHLRQGGYGFARVCLLAK